MQRIGVDTEIRRCLIWLFLGCLVGWILGRFYPCVLVAALLYLAHFFYSLYKFEKWIKKARRKRFEQNDQKGIWAELIDDVLLLSKRYKKDKRRLQAVVSRVQQMTSALTDSVILLDNQDNVEWWNQASQSLFGFKKIDIGHKLVNILRHPKLIEYFADEKFDNSLYFFAPRNREVQLELQVHAFGKGEKLIIVRDITRLQKLEQMRKDFVGNVSHELRTPLTVIGGYVETFKDQQDIPKGWHKALDQMSQQVSRMNILIQDLIELSKLETDDKEDQNSPVNLTLLIEKILSNARSAFKEKKHTFALLAEREINIYGSEKELYSAFSNLIYNSAKYSEKKKDITIEIKITDIDLVVNIIDKGFGIDPKHIPRLTERFYRVDNSRNSDVGGTGLGLAIVKHALIRHDAELKIKSKYSKGSRFSCHFPLYKLCK